VGGLHGLLGRAVEERAMPGVVALVGNRDGVLYEGAFGVLDVNGEDPADGHHL
jgi:hypothetical protein